MIENAFLLLRDELQAFLTANDPSATVVIDNIGMLETASADSLSNNIVLTLVNMEDPNAMKFWSRLKRLFGLGNSTENTPELPNLYILFSYNFSGNGYQLALRRLDHTRQFLQSKTVFSASSAAAGINGGTDRDFTLEFCNLTLKNTDQLWGSLGGRQVPFTLYKLRFAAT